MYTLIKNGIIVNYDEVFTGHILIKDNIISKVYKGDPFIDISSDIEQLENIEIVDAENNYVFPGFIDPHTHPGLPEDLGFFKATDDFETETRAALAGGTTTIIDFAEQQKGERLIDALKKRQNRYMGKAGCRYTFHVAVTDLQKDLYEQLLELKEAGINSVKLYSTYGMKLSNIEMLTVMDYCSRLDITVMVHCEEDSIIQYCSKELNFEHSRPVYAEQNMVSTIINFSKLTGCTVYICHVSSMESAKTITAAKGEGVKVYFETCPQYLLLNSEKYSIPNSEITKYILSPPLRDIIHNKYLLEQVLNGHVDVISTDHCAFAYKEHKAKFYPNLTKAAKGIPGIQMRVRLMYSLLVEENNMNLKDFVKVMTYNAARIFNLKDRGYIGEGMLGDIVIWGKDNSLVRMDEICEGTDYSPYEGMKISGKINKVIFK